MRRLLVKFTVPYRLLKPRGYTFHKLYAGNYRTYQKAFGPNDSIWIFVKGNDFEVLDLYSKSGWLVNCLVKNRQRIPELADCGAFSIRMNTTNGKCWHYDRNEMWRAIQIEKRLYERAKKTSGGEEALRKYFDKWRTIHIKMDMVEEIL